MNDDVSKSIADCLLDIEAVKVSMDPLFTWTSGIQSPIYCDNRKLISYPEHRMRVVNAWKHLLHAKVEAGEMQMPNVIGGTATAAIPWAAFLAYDLELPMIYIRPEPKGHGAGKQIEGDLKPGQNVLIVEDLISTGGSSAKAVEAVRNEGQCTVTDVFAIVSYELEKSKVRLADANVTLSNLTGFEALMHQASEHGSIKADQLELVLEFKQDPSGWAQKL